MGNCSIVVQEISQARGDASADTSFGGIESTTRYLPGLHIRQTSMVFALSHPPVALGLTAVPFWAGRVPRVNPICFFLWHIDCVVHLPGSILRKHATQPPPHWQL